MGHTPFPSLNLALDEDTAESGSPDIFAEKGDTRPAASVVREGSNKSSQTRLPTSAVSDGRQQRPFRQASISNFYRPAGDQSAKRQKVEQPKARQEDIVIEVDADEGEDDLQKAIKNSLAETGSGRTHAKYPLSVHFCLLMH